ncbi:MAG: hypothetical protein WEE69_00885 [Acidimicrobiia bacterium]
MSTNDHDDLLRGALRDDAGAGGAPTDAWGRVRARANSIRRRRQMTQRVAAAVTAVGMVAVIVVATGVLKSDEHTIATPSVTGDQIVAVQGPNNGGDRLVVLSADDGRVIRTLTEDVGITFGGISATPDGETVYFSRRRAALPCDRIEVAKVPSAGGDVEVVATGTNPLVSPDGRTLEYVRSPAADPCGRRTEVISRNLETGEETVWVASEACEGCATLSPVAWSPDSARWIVAGCCANEWWSSVSVVPVGSPGDTRFLNLPTPADGATYLPDGRVLVALEDSAPPDGAQLHKLVVFESVPGPAQNDPPTGDDLLLEPVETIFETRQGGVLHISANSSGDVLMHFGGSLLQRWHPGDTEPTTITDDVREAAWLPRSIEPPPDPVTTTTAPLTVTAPASLVVARTDRRLEVINADGSVVRVIGTASLDYHRLELAPDGRTLYYEQGGTDRCGTSGEIGRVRIDEETLAFEHLAMGSFMSLNSDGTKLAYRSGVCGPGPLMVRDLETDAERSFTLAQPNDGGPGAELVGAVGWDADNRHVMVRVNREPTTEFWYVDTATTGELSGPTFRALGEQGAEQGPTNFAPLGTTGRWAAVYEAVGGSSLVEYDLAGNSIVRPLAELPTRGVTIVGSDPTGQQVLLLVPSESGFELWRRSAGDAVATLVAAGVVAADW